jgi:hypothetical protein
MKPQIINPLAITMSCPEKSGVNFGQFKLTQNGAPRFVTLPLDHSLLTRGCFFDTRLTEKQLPEVIC